MGSTFQDVLTRLLNRHSKDHRLRFSLSFGDTLNTLSSLVISDLTSTFRKTLSISNSIPFFHKIIHPPGKYLDGKVIPDRTSGTDPDSGREVSRRNSLCHRDTLRDVVVPLWFDEVRRLLFKW